jgi:hypothetical protein
MSKKLVPYLADRGFNRVGESKINSGNSFVLMKLDGLLMFSFKETVPRVWPTNLPSDRHCFKKKATNHLEKEACSPFTQITIGVVQRSSLYHCIVDFQGLMSDRFKIICDMCGTTSDLYQTCGCRPTYDKWVSGHILECKEVDQQTK